MKRYLKHLPKQVKNLTIEQLKLIHFQIISFQKQDYLPLPKEKEKLLESALLNINQTFGGKDLYPTKCDKAIQLLIGIESSQAFPDGNKRVALAAFEMFLKINKSTLNPSISQKKKTEFVLSVAKHTLSKENAIQCCIRALKN